MASDKLVDFDHVTDYISREARDGGDGGRPVTAPTWRTMCAATRGCWRRFIIRRSNKEYGLCGLRPLRKEVNPMARKIVEIPDASRSGGSITRQTDTGTGGKTTQSGAYMRTATPRTTSMNRTATPRTTSMNRTATPRTTSMNRTATPRTTSMNRTATPRTKTESYKRTQTPLKKKVK